MEYNNMRDLKSNEIEEINGAKFSWGGLAGSMGGGALTGGVAASIVPGAGTLAGAGAGALLGGMGYLTSELIQLAV